MSERLLTAESAECCRIRGSNHLSFSVVSNLQYVFEVNGGECYCFIHRIRRLSFLFLFLVRSTAMVLSIRRLPSIDYYRAVQVWSVMSPALVLCFGVSLNRVVNNTL